LARRKQIVESCKLPDRIAALREFDDRVGPLKIGWLIVLRPVPAKTAGHGRCWQGSCGFS
jgi:hypothetical protein